MVSSTEIIAPVLNLSQMVETACLLRTANAPSSGRCLMERE